MERSCWKALSTWIGSNFWPCPHRPSMTFCASVFVSVVLDAHAAQKVCILLSVSYLCGL